MTKDFEYKDYQADSVQPTTDSLFFLDHISRYYYAQKLVGPGCDVLDVACGKGYGSAILSQSAKTVTGIDLNEKSLEIAANNYQAENTTFKKHDALQCSELNQQYDLITAFEVIEHIHPRANRFISSEPEVST